MTDPLKKLPHIHPPRARDVDDVPFRAEVYDAAVTAMKRYVDQALDWSTQGWLPEEQLDALRMTVAEAVLDAVYGETWDQFEDECQHRRRIVNGPVT